MIKTFRDKLTDGEQTRIPLAGGDPDTGYRVVKLIIMPEDPGTTDFEHTIKIFKVKQTTATADIDFADETILAAAFTEGNNSSNYIGQPLVAFFDNEIVNQDIYVTHVDAKGSLACNYYLELEEVKMPKSEQAVVNFKAALLHGE